MVPDAKDADSAVAKESAVCPNAIAHSVNAGPPTTTVVTIPDSLIPVTFNLRPWVVVEPAGTVKEAKMPSTFAAKPVVSNAFTSQLIS